MDFVIICILELWLFCVILGKINGKPKRRGGSSGKDAPKPFWVPQSKKK